jgi:50S ribosomal subunit-associated GTPase HflX
MNKFLEKDSTRARFFSEEGYNPGFKESGIELDYMEDNLIFKKPGETLAHMAEVKIEKKLRKIDEKIKKLKEQEQEQNKIQKTEEK